MSTPGVNPALTQSSTSTPATVAATTTPAAAATTASAPTTFWALVWTIIASFGGVFTFLLHAAAAKLSYDKYQSVAWATLDFFFGSVYIPYYAFFLNTPAPAAPASILGGRRRR